MAMNIRPIEDADASGSPVPPGQRTSALVPPDSAMESPETAPDPTRLPPNATPAPAEDEPIEEVLWRFAEENGWLDKPRPPLIPRPPEPKSIHQMTPEEMHESLPVHLRQQRPDGTYVVMGLISRMQQDLEDLTQGKRAATYPEVDEYLGYALLAEGLAPRGLSAADAVKWWRAGGSAVLSERPTNTPMSAPPGGVYQSARPDMEIRPSAADGPEPPTPDGGLIPPTQISFIGHPLMASVNGKIDLAALSGAEVSGGATMAPVADPTAGFTPYRASEARYGSYTAIARPGTREDHTDKVARDRLLNSAGLLDLQKKRSLGLATDDPYSSANLNLGVNQQYAEAIVMAAWKFGLPPHTLAAFIGAEASTNRRGEWDTKSANSRSSARGLTQFLDKTWIDEGQRRGSYLNEVTRALGYLDRKGRVLPAYRKALLDLRFNADHSINVAADYASHNLAVLHGHRLIRDNSPAALARYAYIAHHEGATGAIYLLRGDRLDQAYRDFINDYTDEHIDVTRYMYDPGKVTVPATHTLYRQRK